MMFLQYAIWGAWAPVLSEYLLNDLGFSGIQVGVIYSLLPLATIIAPFIGGQIADRYFAAQKVVALLQLVGGLFLFYISSISNYSEMLWMMFIYSLLYAPTLALTNSIAFINLKNSEKEFGQIRVWGTIGWIVAGLALTGWRTMSTGTPAIEIAGDTLVLAGGFSIIMGLLSFAIPNTPPTKKAAHPLAFLEAVKMLNNKNIIIFFIVAFVVSTELMFYNILTSPFLTSVKIGIDRNSVSGVMIVGQIAEILVMAFLLPYYLPRFGIRRTMIFGILAWPLRYLIFAIGSPVWLVIASLALHGFCYVFFFTVAFIYVDRVAAKDIRHSAQSLINLVVLGLGSFIGSIFAGYVQSTFTVGAETDWTNVFLVPFVLTILCAIAFLIFFKEEEAPASAASG